MPRSRKLNLCYHPSLDEAATAAWNIASAPFATSVVVKDILDLSRVQVACVMDSTELLTPPIMLPCERFGPVGGKQGYLAVDFNPFWKERIRGKTHDGITLLSLMLRLDDQVPVQICFNVYWVSRPHLLGPKEKHQRKKKSMRPLICKVRPFHLSPPPAVSLSFPSPPGCIPAIEWDFVSV